MSGGRGGRPPKEPDMYAKGWDAGVEQCRRILSVRLGEPEEALSMIHDLLIDANRAQHEPVSMPDRRGGLRRW